MKVSGVAWTSSRARRARIDQTTSTARKLSANATPPCSGEPGVPTGTCGASSGDQAWAAM